jgi:hypothetical protein
LSPGSFRGAKIVVSFPEGATIREQLSIFIEHDSLGQMKSVSWGNQNASHSTYITDRQISRRPFVEQLISDSDSCAALHPPFKYSRQLVRRHLCADKSLVIHCILWYCKTVVSAFSFLAIVKATFCLSFRARLRTFTLNRFCSCFSIGEVITRGGLSYDSKANSRRI